MASPEEVEILQQQSNKGEGQLVHEHVPPRGAKPATRGSCGDMHRERTCFKHCLAVFLKNFAVGSAGKTLLNVISFILARRRKKKMPKRLVEKLLRLIDFRWGMFLGSLAGVWKVISCGLKSLILQHYQQQAGSLAGPEEVYRKVSQKGYLLWVDLIAGGATGLSLLFMKREDRKTMAIYSLVRSMEFLCHLLSIQHRLPQFVLRMGQHVDVFLMCLAAGQSMYTPTLLLLFYLLFLFSLSLSLSL